MSKYKRNAPAVLAQLSENSSGQIIAKANCKIQVPVRFSQVGLGQVGIQTFTLGCFALILSDTDEYAVCNLNSLVELNPFKVTTTMINEVEYHVFHFEPGQVVIKSTTVVKRDDLMYNIIDELVFKGKVPWYVEYEDLGKLFDTAKSHADSNVGQNHEVIELLASIVTRPKNDRVKYIRSVAKSYSDTAKDNIDYVPLQSIFYSVNNTVNKLAGSYFSDGVISALVTPSTEVSTIESILRA